MRQLSILIAFVAVGLIAFEARALDPKAIMRETLAHDHWGLSGARIEATVLLVDRRGRRRKLAFKALSKRWKGHLTKSLVRFLQPPNLAGAGFLQIQNDDTDDSRFLYLPALKRSRRVAASQRSTSFMGTDFNFSDIDRRDWRKGQYKAGSPTRIGKFPCHNITIYPKRSDSPYSKLVVDIRQDNFVPLRIRLYDRAKAHYKTLEVFQVRRVSGQWFISKSRMTNHREKRSTTLHLVKIQPSADTDDSVFTKRSLER